MADELPTPSDGTARRGPGRPRKWADDAERVRAYRARKAEEHAAADELRRDRRALRRQVVGLTEKLERAERTAADAERRAETLGKEVGQLRVALEASVAEVRRLRQELGAASAAPAKDLTGREDVRWAASERSRLQEETPPVQPALPPVGLSRAQRRELERRERRR